MTATHKKLTASLFSTLLMLSIGQVFAADEFTPNATLSAGLSNQAGTSNAEILRQINQDLIVHKINVFRSTVRTTTTVKNTNFFSRLVSSPANLIDAELLADMNQFTQRNLARPETAEVFHLKALVHQRDEKYYAAALDWLMLQVIYPDSAFAIEAAKQLKELSNDTLKKQAGVIANLAQAIPTLKGDRDQRIAQFLLQFNKLGEEGFASAVISEGEAFLFSNETYLSEDLIEHVIARQAMLVDNQIAIYHFNKLLTFYPTSTTRTDSLWSLANLQRKGMKQFDQAAKTYSKLITEFPDTTESKWALEVLAKMYEDDLKDYSNALKTHAAIVAKYNEEPIVLRSLNAMALLYQNKTNEPAKAIERYLKIADTFKGGEALDALIKAEKVAVISKNWKPAFEINTRITNLVPKTEEAAKALFGNADIAENQLNDKASAIKLYSSLIAQYPTHPLANDAAKRLAILAPAAPAKATTP